MKRIILRAVFLGGLVYLGTAIVAICALIVFNMIAAKGVRHNHIWLIYELVFLQLIGIIGSVLAGWTAARLAKTHPLHNGASASWSGVFLGLVSSLALLRTIPIGLSVHCAGCLIFSTLGGWFESLRVKGV